MLGLIIMYQLLRYLKACSFQVFLVVKTEISRVLALAFSELKVVKSADPRKGVAIERVPCEPPDSLKELFLNEHG